MRHVLTREATEALILELLGDRLEKIEARLSAIEDHLGISRHPESKKLSSFKKFFKK